VRPATPPIQVTEVHLRDTLLALAFAGSISMWDAQICTSSNPCPPAPRYRMGQARSFPSRSSSQSHDSIVQSWDEAVGPAAMFMARSMSKPDERLSAEIQATAGRELNEAQEKFESAMDQWFRVAREYLRRAAPS
jgi:hypothetical protein